MLLHGRIGMAQVAARPRSSARRKGEERGTESRRAAHWIPPWPLAAGRRLAYRRARAAAKALRCVKPLLAAINASPRVIKRYQNRMRYLAARLRLQTHEPDRIDSLLHWLGRKLLSLKRPLVPPAWFEELPRQAIPEPTLILLGAIELLAPRAFADPPGELLANLDAAAPPERARAWTDVRTTFAVANLDLPTVDEVKRYAAFVQATGRPAPSPRPSNVVDFRQYFPPHGTPGPRSA